MRNKNIMIDTWIIIMYLLVAGAIVSPYMVAKKVTSKAKKELEDLYVTTIQEQKAKIKHLNGIIARMQQQETEVEEDDSDLVQMLAPLAQKYGIPEELLSDPSVMKTVKKYKHLLPLVARFLPAQQQGFNSNTMV